MIKYTDEVQSAVSTGGMVIPRGHRFWVEYEIDKAEEAGEILPHDYLTPEQQLEQDKAEARAYLLKTDFMTLREAEGGEPMPADVKAQRAEYRILLDGSLNL